MKQKNPSYDGLLSALKNNINKCKGFQRKIIFQKMKIALSRIIMKSLKRNDELKLNVEKSPTVDLQSFKIEKEIL